LWQIKGVIRNDHGKGSSDRKKKGGSSPGEKSMEGKTINWWKKRIGGANQRENYQIGKGRDCIRWGMKFHTYLNKGRKGALPGE